MDDRRVVRRGRRREQFIQAGDEALAVRVGAGLLVALRGVREQLLRRRKRQSAVAIVVHRALDRGRRNDVRGLADAEDASGREDRERNRSGRAADQEVLDRTERFAGSIGDVLAQDFADAAFPALHARQLGVLRESLVGVRTGLVLRRMLTGERRVARQRLALRSQHEVPVVVGREVQRLDRHEIVDVVMILAAHDRVPHLVVRRREQHVDDLRVLVVLRVLDVCIDQVGGADVPGGCSRIIGAEGERTHADGDHGEVEHRGFQHGNLLEMNASWSASRGARARGMQR
jgi:hypothetical protein